MDKKLIANRLVNLRGDKSRESVAESCGISVSALAMYEKGNRIPRDDIKMRIAKYYGCSVESIFFNTKSTERA